MVGGDSKGINNRHMERAAIAMDTTLWRPQFYGNSFIDQILC